MVQGGGPRLRDMGNARETMADMTHEEIWNAIDALAASRSVSVSRLARNAGLDPTTFNRSKRVSPDGRLRWPSTESISKVLTSTGASLAEMMQFPGASVRVPVIGIAHAGNSQHLGDGGEIKGTAWQEIVLPLPSGGRTVAFKVEGDSMLPLYREGDMLVVDPNGPMESGDRVVVRTSEGDVMAKELAARDENAVVLRALHDAQKDMTYRTDEVEWMGRIVWASQ